MRGIDAPILVIIATADGACSPRELAEVLADVTLRDLLRVHLPRLLADGKVVLEAGPSDVT